MLQGGFTEVLSSRDRDEFRGEIVAFRDASGSKRCRRPS
jgi:hypothetical protein